MSRKAFTAMGAVVRSHSHAVELGDLIFLFEQPL